MYMYSFLVTHFSENPGILLVGIPTINDQRDAEEEAMVHDSRVHVYGVRMARVEECAWLVTCGSKSEMLAEEGRQQRRVLRGR